jgi:hypothetical protein
LCRISDVCGWIFPSDSLCCNRVEAISIVLYLKNRIPTKSLENKIPFEAFYGFKPEVNHPIIFGSKAFYHVPKVYSRKLDAKTIKHIFIGYCTDHKEYKMYDPNTHKVFSRKYVLFHEHVDEGQKHDSHGVWHLPNDIDESVKEEGIDRFKMKFQSTWTLQIARVHQEGMKELHKEEEEVKELHKAV